MKLPDKIHAMVLDKQGQPLQYKELPLPVINAEQVLVKVLACGVCRTDLHVVDSELGNINILWGEGVLCSVANLTWQNAAAFPVFITDTQ